MGESIDNTNSINNEYKNCEELISNFFDNRIWKILEPHIIFYSEVYSDEIYAEVYEEVKQFFIKSLETIKEELSETIDISGNDFENFVKYRKYEFYTTIDNYTASLREEYSESLDIEFDLTRDKFEKYSLNDDTSQEIKDYYESIREDYNTIFEEEIYSEFFYRIADDINSETEKMLFTVVYNRKDNVFSGVIGTDLMDEMEEILVLCRKLRKLGK